jgi:hypothetical protein
VQRLEQATYPFQLLHLSNESVRADTMEKHIPSFLPFGRWNLAQILPTGQGPRIVCHRPAARPVHLKARIPSLGIDVAFGFKVPKQGPVSKIVAGEQTGWELLFLQLLEQHETISLVSNHSDVGIE